MTTSPFNGRFKKLGLPAALVVGGVTVGSFLAPIGLASAQEADDTDDTESTEAESTDSTESDAEGESEERSGRKGRRGAKLDAVSEALGLTEDEVKQGLKDGKSLATLATEQGVAVADLEAALVAAADERIDEAVAEGKIDEDRAAEMRESIEERVGELVQRDPSEFEGRRGRGHGKALRGSGIGDEVAEVLGLSTEEIREGMQDGKSLADLAEEQGVSAEDVAAAMTAGLTERLDGAVTEGKIDQEKADEALERFSESVDDLVNGEFEHTHRHGHGRRGQSGERGADQGGEIEETSISA